MLSAEEKRTLVQEGYELPTTLPLSREQEEALKVVRRKIKNKVTSNIVSNILRMKQLFSYPPKSLGERERSILKA